MANAMRVIAKGARVREKRAQHKKIPIREVLNAIGPKHFNVGS
jgi:hypothetical protein